MKKALIAFGASTVVMAMIGGAFLFAKEKNPISNNSSSGSNLPIVQAKDSDKPKYQEDQLLIQLKDKNQSVKEYLEESPVKEEIKEETAQPIEKNTPLEEEEESSDIYQVETTQDAKEVAQKLEQQPEVEFAEPNYILETSLIPNDSQYSQQWGVRKTRLPQAWSLTTGSTSVTIAVVDTGVDWNHPDLANNIWANLDEAVNGADSDSNGYIDDIRGWDFVTQTTCYPGEDCDGVTDNNPMDFQGHGTAVGGIASAVTNNSAGVAGAGWQTKIMAVRAGYARAGDGRGVLLISDAANAIRYAAANGADIINMSWGGSSSTTIKEAINYAFNQNCLMVAAAGNSNSKTRFYPAALNQVLSVGGTVKNDKRWSSSSYGNWVNIAAPAYKIRTTVYNNSYTTASGTSLASPLVAGIAGLIKAYRPSYGKHYLARSLIAYTDEVGNFGVGGRVSARRALSLVRRHPNGTVIRRGRSQTKYLLQNGYKKRMASNKVFKNRCREQDIVRVNRNEFQRYKTGKTLGFKDGTLLRPQGTNSVFVIENGRRRKIKNNQVFRRYGYKWSSVISVSRKLFRKRHKKGRVLRYKNRHPNGSLLRNRRTGTIYYIKNTKKWPISHSSVFRSWKFRYQDIIRVSSRRLKRHRTADFLPHREGTLIRRGKKEVYYINGNIRQMFKSNNRLKQLGYHKRNAYRASHSLCQRYKYGLLPRL